MKILKRLHFLIILISTLSIKVGISQSDSLLISKLRKFSLSGFGAMNYYHFNWQTDSIKRDAIDNERFVLELGYRWTDRIKLNTEIEFEHGGTGVDLEFDRFEEFGEFEFDVTKGGEVLIEQMNMEFLVFRKNTLKVGRVRVPFGLSFENDEPTDYLTAINSELESQILPENWTENGFLWKGSFSKKSNWTYHLAMVNGLDGSAFNSSNWIKRGNQRRFEMVNAENFAFVLRIDYQNKLNSLGLSLYGSNTTDNRPKPDLRVSTPLGIGECHFQTGLKFWKINGMILYGYLSNSEALSHQNRNLSNNLNVKRTPVGQSTLGYFVQTSFKLFGNESIFSKWINNEFLVYGRYDYYDTQHSTEGLIFNNPRWERTSWSFGGVFKLIDEVQFKAQYNIRKVGAPAPTSVGGGRLEKTFITGFAFEF